MLFKMEKALYLRTSMCLIRRSMCTPAPQSSETSERRTLSPKYKPTDFQKFLLVWTKKFKTKEAIPPLVSHEIIDRSKSEARIKLANVLMLLTALASLGAVISGKAAAKRGESVHQMNLDWHKKYEEDHKDVGTTAK